MSRDFQMSGAYPYKTKDFLDSQNLRKCSQCGFTSSIESTRNHISRVHIKAREVPLASESLDIFNTDIQPLSEDSLDSLPFPSDELNLSQEQAPNDPPMMETSPPSTKKARIQEGNVVYDFNFSGAQHLQNVNISINSRQVVTTTVEKEPEHVKPVAVAKPAPDQHESSVCPIRGFELPNIEDFQLPVENEVEFDAGDEMRLLEDLFHLKLAGIESEKLKKFLNNPADYKQFWPDCCQAMRKLARANQKASENDRTLKNKDCYLFTTPFFIPKKPTLRCNYANYLFWSSFIFF